MIYYSNIVNESLHFLCVYTVASWFLSPLLSGIMSGVLFYFVRMFILHKVSSFIGETQNMSF